VIFEINNPTTVRIPKSLDLDSLKFLLTFKEKSIEYQLNKALKTKKKLPLLEKVMKSNKFAAYKEALLVNIQDLTSKLHTCLLFKDSNGYYTHSGLSSLLVENFGGKIVRTYNFPEPKFLAWNKEPIKKMRPYQKEALDKLLDIKHGAVEIGTGLGKSFILLNIIKRLGLRTVVMTPSVSIAGQLYEELSKAFGKKKVGAFFSGKKECDKLVTIAVGASLTKVTEGSLAWEELSKADVLIVDESHMTPAETLKVVCFGLLKKAAYRLFFSGTQMRNDGRDMLLNGIIGPIVYSMTVREGVDGGYLAKPIFHMVNVLSAEPQKEGDPAKTTRKHLYYNDIVNKAAAKIIDLAVERQGHQVLVLVEELEQFAHLLRFVKSPMRFAHGGITEATKDKIPKEYHTSDPQALVDLFNANKIPVLVGTSCIATGTDIRENRSTVYLMGGTSEIQVRQAVGRNTRLTEGKTSCHHFDFSVSNVPLLERHAECRRAIYEDIYGPVRTIRM